MRELAVEIPSLSSGHVSGKKSFQPCQCDTDQPPFTFLAHEGARRLIYLQTFKCDWQQLRPIAVATSFRKPSVPFPDVPCELFPRDGSARNCIRPGVVVIFFSRCFSCRPGWMAHEPQPRRERGGGKQTNEFKLEPTARAAEEERTCSRPWAAL